MVSSIKEKINVSWLKKRALWLVLALSLIVTFVAQYRAFDYYTVNDDVRQHIYWMAKFDDPELFKDDILTDYISSSKFQQPGFTLLYHTANFLIDPITFSKILPFILIPFSCFFLFKLSRLFSSELTAFLIVTLFLVLIWELDRFSGGLPRSFSIPFLLTFLYVILKKRYLWGLFIITLTTVVYPVSYFICSGVLGLVMIKALVKKDQKAKTLVLVTVVAALVGTFMFMPKILDKGSDPYGPTITKQEAKMMPEFREGGRNPVFYDNYIDYLAKSVFDRSAIGVRPGCRFVLLIGIILIPFVGCMAFKLPAPIWFMLISSVGFFIFAHITYPLLHNPSRFTQDSLPVIINIFCMMNFERARERILLLIKSEWIQRLGVYGLIILQIMLPLFVANRYLNRWNIYLFRCPSPSLVEFLATLPKDSLIAGEPFLMNWVPLFSKRKVLANEEISFAYSKRFYEEIKRRITDFYKAYYAEDNEVIVEFAKKYGISYLVLEKDHFDRTYLMEGKFYYEPFNSKIKNWVKDKKDYALLRWASTKIVWEDDKYQVLTF